MCGECLNAMVRLGATYGPVDEYDLADEGYGGLESWELENDDDS